MTTFIIASAALILLTLAFVLRPLWRGSNLIAAGLFITLAIATGLIYQIIGTPAALDPSARRAPETLSDAVAQLEAELKRNPGQAEGWRLLARAYTAEQRTTDARDAFARAAKLEPDNPDVLVEYAESRALAESGRRFDVEAIALLQRALSIQPQHQRARWFLGIAQRQAGKSADAARTWEPLLTQVDQKTASSLREQINAARSEAGLPPIAATDAASRSIEIAITLAPGLAAKLPTNSSLFVIARQKNGPPMPVAVKKLPARGFPLRVQLDDSDSPMPTLKLSQAGEVQISARISVSGDAIPKAGDYESASVSVRADAVKPIDIVIDHVVE